MDYHLAIAIALIVSITTTVALGWTVRQVARRSEGWRDLETRRVVVNLKSGQAIDGHLIRRRGTLLILRGAQLHEPGAEPVPLDGETIIDRAEVDFIQAP